MARDGNIQNLPKHMTYSKSDVPFIGALIDYIETSFQYLRRRTFAQAEKLNGKTSRATLSATFMAGVCLVLGLVSNVKFEVVTFDEEPLPNDLHFMIMSKDDKLYIDDIDVSRSWSKTAYVSLIITCDRLLCDFIVVTQQYEVYIGTVVFTTNLSTISVVAMDHDVHTEGPELDSRGNFGVMWCIEASDGVVILISCLLIWTSSHVKSPLSEYLFLPWLGATLRGIFLRQAPTAGALLYTMAVVNGNINLLFLTTFSLVFLLEARMWLEIARLVRARWERRNNADSSRDQDYEVETLWSNDDVQSVEVRNYVY